MLGVLFGRKAKSVGTVGRALSALRGASRFKREAADVVRATGRLEDLYQQLIDLEVDSEGRLAAQRDDLETSEPGIECLAIAARKNDLTVDDQLMAWVPESGGPGQ